MDSVKDMKWDYYSKENITRNIDQDPVKFSCSIDVQNQSHTLSPMALYSPDFSSQPTILQTTQLLPLNNSSTTNKIPTTNNFSI